MSGRTSAGSLARGFDRLAPVYDLMADLAFAGRIHASQVALLPGLPPIGRALVIGGGTALPDFNRAFSKAGLEVVTSPLSWAASSARSSCASGPLGSRRSESRE